MCVTLIYEKMCSPSIISKGGLSLEGWGKAFGDLQHGDVTFFPNAIACLSVGHILLNCG